MDKHLPDPTEKVLHCYHCGNELPMRLLTFHWEKGREKIFCDIDYEIGEEIDAVYIDYEDQWNLYKCPVCHQVTLEHLSWNSEYSWDWRDTLSEEILYPKVEIKSEFFPKYIREEFEKLLKAKGNKARIMHMRNIVEAICEDKEAKGRDLDQKIDDLLGILSESLKEASQSIRILGNTTVHPYDVEFPNEIVDRAFKWLLKILDYVYVLPNEIASLKPEIKKIRKEAIEKKKAEKKNETEKSKE